MNAFDRSTYRRLESGLRWPTSQPPKRNLWNVAKSAAIVVLIAFSFLGWLSFEHSLELEAKLADQTRQTLKFSGLLAMCMNGGAVFDRASNRAHFCGRAVEVQL